MQTLNGWKVGDPVANELVERYLKHTLYFIANSKLRFEFHADDSGQLHESFGIRFVYFLYEALITHITLQMIIFEQSVLEVIQIIPNALEHIETCCIKLRRCCSRIVLWVSEVFRFRDNTLL